MQQKKSRKSVTAQVTDSSTPSIRSVSPTTILREYACLRRLCPSMPDTPIIGYMGHQFFWQKGKNELLSIFSFNEQKDLRLLCKRAADDKLNGVGFITMACVLNVSSESYILNLYKVSSDIDQWQKLLNKEQGMADMINIMLSTGPDTQLTLTELS